MIRQKPFEGPARKREGVAAVEFAVCLPILVLVFLGAVECANMVYLKQTLTVSCYEGVRKAIQFNSNNTQALERANNILAARNVQQATVTFNPANVANVPKGQPIVATVSAPCDANTPFPLAIFDGQTISVTVKMIKE